jgi:hypothetical protein
MAHGIPTVECKKTLCMVRMGTSGLTPKELVKELMGFGSKKSTQPLALPVGTQLSAISGVPRDQQQGAAAEYMVFMRYMQATEQP